MYFAITMSAQDKSKMHHPVRESIGLAMRDADEHPADDAQVIRCDGMRMVAAGRDAGGMWHTN
jgi:hypothetical protein